MTNNNKMLIKMLLDTYPYNFSHGMNDEKLLWKDFLLRFKWGHSSVIGDFNTKQLSDILRELLDIDQEKDVRSGIKLTFQEWIKKYYKV